MDLGGIVQTSPSVLMIAGADGAQIDVAFEAEVRQYGVIGDRLVVLLAAGAQGEWADLIAIDSEGVEIWKCAAPKDIMEENIWLAFSVEDSQLLATDYLGYRYHVDIKTGRVIRPVGWTK
jgi:hypothetical protein